MESIVAPEHEFKLTDDYKYDANHRRFMVRLTNGKRNVFINRQSLAVFDNPQFYQESPNCLIVVTERDHPVGVVMPMRIGTDVDTLYTDMEKWRVNEDA